MSISIIVKEVIAFGELIFGNRDPSHGKEHAERVSLISIIIFDNEYKFDKSLLPALYITAYLHDANDRKYEIDGNLTKQMYQFLCKMWQQYKIVAYNVDGSKVRSGDEFANIILKVIEYISFTKEDDALTNGSPINYQAILGTWGLTLRNIVSDADKIDSLGNIGIVRCSTYTRMNWKSKNIEFTEDDVRVEVQRLFDMRFNRLVKEFLRTKTGMRLATPMLEEMRLGILKI